MSCSRVVRYGRGCAGFGDSEKAKTQNRILSLGQKSVRKILKSKASKKELWSKVLNDLESVSS